MRARPFIGVCVYVCVSVCVHAHVLRTAKAEIYRKAFYIIEDFFFFFFPLP